MKEAISFNGTSRSSEYRIDIASLTQWMTENVRGFRGPVPVEHQGRKAESHLQGEHARQGIRGAQATGQSFARRARCGARGTRVAGA